MRVTEQEIKVTNHQAFVYLQMVTGYDTWSVKCEVSMCIDQEQKLPSPHNQSLVSTTPFFLVQWGRYCCRVGIPVARPPLKFIFLWTAWKQKHGRDVKNRYYTCCSHADRMWHKVSLMWGAQAWSKNSPAPPQPSVILVSVWSPLFNAMREVLLQAAVSGEIKCSLSARGQILHFDPSLNAG